MMRIVLWIVGVIVAAIGIIAIVGWRLPVAHVASRSVRVPATPERVFALISRPEDYASWRPDVKKIDVTDGGTKFVEEGGNGRIAFEVVERTPPSRFVTRIADKSLPFGGRWIYEITPVAGGGSELRITEEGEVYNPIFRFVSRYIMGHTATMDAYLANVERKMGKG